MTTQYKAVITLLHNNGWLLGGIREHHSSWFGTYEEAQAFAEQAVKVNRERPGYRDADIRFQLIGREPMPKRIKRITSHVGHARFLATLADTNYAIPRVAAITSPYAYSPTHTVYRLPSNELVFIVETKHKTYDVFLVPADANLLPADVS